MNTPIVTTQKTSSRYLISKLMFDAIFLIIGIYFFSLVDDLSAQWRYDLIDTVKRAGWIFVILGLAFAVYHVMASQTYVDIYADRLEGKGMQKFTAQSISLRFDQVTDISLSKGFMNVEVSGLIGFLVISTVAGSYKIVTTTERAKEIIDFYKKEQGKA